MNFKLYSNKQLLEEFAHSFGLSVFYKNKEVHEAVEEMKAEILERMKRSIITEKDLMCSLVDESVIIGNENVDVVFNALKSKINFDTPETKNQSATIISIIDSSGSMGSFEKHMSRCVSYWTEKLLETKYQNIKHRFIIHHTESKEVHRDVFFVKGESGGTIISSGLNKANELINRFDYENEDIYVFQYSDGDNLTSDNDVSNRVLKDILNKVKQFEYVEINQYNRSSTILNTYRKIQKVNFNFNVVASKDDVLKVVTNIAKIMFL